MKKWYPIEYSGFWHINDAPFYEGKDVLDAEAVGADVAKENAELAASAPELLAENIKLKETLSKFMNLEKNQTIKVVENNNSAKFEAEVNQLLSEGYVISSTACGFVNSERYDFISSNHAILVKAI